MWKILDINYNHFYHTGKSQVLAGACYYFRPSKPHSGTLCTVKKSILLFYLHMWPQTVPPPGPVQWRCHTEDCNSHKPRKYLQMSPGWAASWSLLRPQCPLTACSQSPSHRWSLQKPGPFNIHTFTYFSPQNLFKYYFHLIVCTLPAVTKSISNQGYKPLVANSPLGPISCHTCLSIAMNMLPFEAKIFF